MGLVVGERAVAEGGGDQEGARGRATVQDDGGAEHGIHRLALGTSTPSPTSMASKSGWSGGILRAHHRGGLVSKIRLCNLLLEV